MAAALSNDRVDALLAEAEACLARFNAQKPGMAAALDSWHGLPVRATTDPATLQRVARHIDDLNLALRLVRELEARGVPAVVVKGPHLQEHVYGESVLRAYSDVDLVVARRDFPRAREVLSRSGWASTTPAWARHIHFHEVFRQPGNPTPVELHRSLVDRANFYRLPDDVFLNAAQPAATTLGPLPGLRDDHLLVYLCLHIAKHGFLNEVALGQGRDASWFLQPSSGNRLVWFLDVALLLESLTDDLPTGSVPETTPARDIRAWNVQSPVATTLAIISKLLPSSRAQTALKQLELANWTQRAPSNAELRLLAHMDRGGAVRTSTGPEIRPARLAQLPALFFPSSDELCAFHRVAKAGLSTRMRHIGVMAKRLLVQ